MKINKLYVSAIVMILLMLGFTYIAVGMDSKSAGGDIVNDLAILGAIVIFSATIIVAIKYVRQMQTDKATGQLSEDSWDGIGEYENELPIGWSIIFLGTIVWAFWYMLFGYPVNAYSQIGEYNKDVKIANAKFEKKYTNLTKTQLTNMGESIFIVDCAACHGLAADGLNGTAANLNKRIQVKSVEYVIEHGSDNHLSAHELATGMPVMSAGLTKKQIHTVAEYVSNGFNKSNKEGAKIFASTCAGCHGADGYGKPYVAPNIHTFTPTLVAHIVGHGKHGAIGVMPAFKNLNSVQLKAVATYVTAISKGE